MTATARPAVSGPRAADAGPRELDRPATESPRALPLRVAAPLAVGAGLLLDVAFPGVGLWPLAFLAPAVLLLLVRGRRLLVGYALAVLFALGFFVPLLQWSGIYVGPVPWLALATLQALLLGLVGPLWVAAWRVAHRAFWTLPVTAPAAWLAVEAFRSRWPFGGFSWGRLGFSQADSPLLGLVAVGGVPALGAGVVAVAAVLALLATRLMQRRDAPRRDAPAGAGQGTASAREPSTVAIGVTAGVTIGVVVLLTALGLAASRVAAQSETDIRVGAVQGNVPEPGLDFNAERRAVLDNHASATETLAAAVLAGQVEPVDVVVWPENSSDIDPLRNADADRVISGAATAAGVPDLVGAVLQEPGENLTNAVLVWEPDSGYRGDDGGRYAKQEPAPFAEYIPYRDFFRTFSSFVDEVRDFVAGPGPAVLDVGGAAIGPVICFEVAEDHVVRGQIAAGADILAVPTNNATFGFSDESVQQLAMSRIRAVEHGRAVVHISTVGVSALITPDGRTGERTELFTQDVLVGELPRATGRTPAAVVGPWPELVAVVVAIGLLVVAFWLPRREEPATAGAAATTTAADEPADSTPGASGR